LARDRRRDRTWDQGREGRPCDPLEHLIQQLEQQQAEGRPHGVPELDPSTETASAFGKPFVDELLDLVDQEGEQVQHEECLRRLPPAVAVVLQVIALVLERIEPLVLDLPACSRPRSSPSQSTAVWMAAAVAASSQSSTMSFKTPNLRVFPERSVAATRREHP
jgi:hypothetical protein